MIAAFRVLAALAWAAGAPCFAAEPLAITAGWVRASPPGASNAAAYLTIANGGAADRLLGGTSPAARELQLHTHVLTDGVAEMRPLVEILLPSGATVELAPGGLHVMLLGITAPLRPGDEVTLRLRFANAGEVAVSLPVRDGRAEPAGH